jgi:hypothetical protein
MASIMVRQGLGTLYSLPLDVRRIVYAYRDVAVQLVRCSGILLLEVQPYLQRLRDTLPVTNWELGMYLRYRTEPVRGDLAALPGVDGRWYGGKERWYGGNVLLASHLLYPDGGAKTSLRSPYHEHVDQGVHVYQILSSEDEPTTARWEGRPTGHSQVAYETMVRQLVRYGRTDALVSWSVLVPLLSKRLLTHDLQTRRRYALSRAATIVRGYLMGVYMQLRDEVIYPRAVLAEYPAMGIPPLDHEETQRRLWNELQNVRHEALRPLYVHSAGLLSLCTVVTADSRDALQMSLGYSRQSVDALPHTITRTYKIVALLDAILRGEDVAPGRWRPLQPSYVSVRRPKHAEGL